MSAAPRHPVSERAVRASKAADGARPGSRAARTASSTSRCSARCPRRSPARPSARPTPTASGRRSSFRSSSARSAAPSRSCSSPRGLTALGDRPAGPSAGSFARSSACRPCRSARARRSRTGSRTRRSRRPAPRAGAVDFSTSSANSIEATPFGPNHAMNSLIGLAEAGPGERRQHRDGPRDEQREHDEGDERAGSRGRQPVATIRAPNMKNDADLEHRADVLVEVAEAVGDVVLRDARARRPATNAAISPLPKVASASPKATQREPERVDALVVARDARRRAAACSAGRRERQHDADHGAERRPRRAAPAPRCAASPPGSASTRKKSTNGQREAVVEAGLEVERVANERRHRCAVTTADVTTGSVGREDGAQQEAFRHSQRGEHASAQTASSASVIGIAITSARAGGPQWRASSSRSTSRPSENRVMISASSTTCLTQVRGRIDRDDVERRQHEPGNDGQHRDRQHAGAAANPTGRPRTPAGRRAAAAPARSRGSSAGDFGLRARVRRLR